jgi:outer membrane protein
MKQIKLITAIVLTSFTALIAHAQQDSVLSISLQQAIDKGLSQRFELKNQKLAIEVSEANIQKYRGANLPQLAMTADMRYNAILATSLIPLNGNTNSLQEVQFGTTYNNSLGLTATQYLYNPLVSSDINIASAQKSFDQAQVEKYTADAKLAITQSYYQVLLAKEQIGLAQENVKNSQAIYNKAKGEFENGALLKSDLSRCQIDATNAQNMLNTALVNYNNSLIQLKMQMAEPISTSIMLADDLQSMISNSKSMTLDGLSNEQHYNYKIESSQLTINALNSKKYTKAHLPTVYLYANAALQNQNQKFTPLDGNTWYPVSYFGIHADIPLFDGFQKSSNQNVYKIKMMQNENNLRKIAFDIETESTKSKNQLTNAYTQYASASENYELVKSIMMVDQERYAKGIITYAALKNTEYSLQNTQNIYLSSIYNVLLAQLDFKKATGTL